MNDRNFYGQDNQEIKTSQNLETIERLFDEWDEEDKTSTDSFTLDGQSASYSEEIIPNFDSSFYETPAENNITHNVSQTPSHWDPDPLGMTQEIDNVSLDKLKEIQAELHKLAEDQQEPEETLDSNQNMSKGKTLVKATKEGRAFAISNGSLTKTFLDCVVLCFVTAAMGLGFLLNILYHI